MPENASRTAGELNEAYRPDCARCQGLCCVGQSHRPENGFPQPKAFGVPCPHLDSGTFACRIYAMRSQFGYTGCATHDCLGTGQKVTAHMEARGHRWPDLEPQVAASYFADMNMLLRIRLLLTWLRHGAAEDHILHAKLESADASYGQPGSTSPGQACEDAVTHHRSSIEALCAAYGTSLRSMFGPNA